MRGPGQLSLFDYEAVGQASDFSESVQSVLSSRQQREASRGPADGNESPGRSRMPRTACRMPERNGARFELVSRLADSGSLPFHFWRSSFSGVLRGEADNFLVYGCLKNRLRRKWVRYQKLNPRLRTEFAHPSEEGGEPPTCADGFSRAAVAPANHSVCHGLSLANRFGRDRSGARQAIRVISH